MNEEIKQQVKELCQDAWQLIERIEELKSNPSITKSVHAQRRLNQAVRFINDAVVFLTDVIPTEQQQFTQQQQEQNGGKVYRGSRRRETA